MLNTQTVIDLAIQSLKKEITNRCWDVGTRYTDQYEMCVGHIAGLTQAVSILEEAALGADEDDDD